MKITIITSPFGYIPPNGIGAVEKLWYDLGIEFKKKGNDVTIISKLSASYDSFKDEIDRVYIKGYRRRNNIYKDLFFDLLYSLKCFLKIKKTDVLVLNTFWTPFLCHLFKRNYVISIYNVQRYPKGQFRYLSHIDKLVACSSMIQKAVLSQTPNICNVCTINNPVNLDIFYPDRKNLIEDTVNVVYTGRIHPEKGLLNLIKALALLTEVKAIKLLLIGTYDIEKGGGGELYRKKLEECAKNVELIFIGEIADPKSMACYMREAHIYCYPPLETTGDAMPCAPLEAMALGLPVIVSDIPCFDDYVVNGENAIRFDVSKNAVINLKRALELLINDEALRLRIGKNASLTAQRFSCSSIADQYLYLFKSLLQNG